MALGLLGAAAAYSQASVNGRSRKTTFASQSEPEAPNQNAFTNSMVCDESSKSQKARKRISPQKNLNTPEIAELSKLFVHNRAAPTSPSCGCGTRAYASGPGRRASSQVAQCTQRYSLLTGNDVILAKSKHVSSDLKPITGLGSAMQ